MSEQASAQALIEDLEVLLPTHLRPGDEPIEFEILRPLTVADIPKLVGLERENSGLKCVTARHHQLAQWVAQGKRAVEISALGGISLGRLSQLDNDPAFNELVAHYVKQRELVFQEINERMKLVGTHALDEIQARLDDAPEKWTNQQLMDLASSMLGKGQSAVNSGQNNGHGGGVQVNVKFISANSVRQIDDGKLIEARVE